jgi:hypothetical protein
LSTLIAAANRLLGQCNQFLRQETGREWLIVGEDFDKPGVSPRQVEDFYLTYANVLKELDAHVIFTIPVSLGYSTRAAQLPVPSHQVVNVADTVVFLADHTPCRPAREALRAVLEARASPDRFAPGQLERLIVASGGNLRDLFSLVNAAADYALVRGEAPDGQIRAEDAWLAIVGLRTDYERRLGESIFDAGIAADSKESIPYEKKAERLRRIYDREPKASIPDPVLYSLLRARAVLEGNGLRWFSIHPLVVDILAKQKEIPRPAQGAVPGGTE